MLPLLALPALLLHAKPLAFQSPFPKTHAKAPAAKAPAAKDPAAKDPAARGAVHFIQFNEPPAFIPPPAPSPTARAPRLMPLDAPLSNAPLSLDMRAQEAREAADLIAAINAERTGRGLAALTDDPLLDGAARAHSDEMGRLGYFDHHSPARGEATPLDRYLAALQAGGEQQPRTALVGENLFYAGVTDALYNADYAHLSLMGSPGHRANILEPRFTKIGVGLYRDPAGRFWVTEMFLRDAK